MVANATTRLFTLPLDIFCIEKLNESLTVTYLRVTYEHRYSPREINIEPTTKIIGRHSFYNCQTVKKVLIPPSVEIIGYNPFARCSNLCIINNSPNFIHANETLYNKHKTIIISYNLSSKEKHIVILNGVERIGRSAFFECVNIKKITIPKTVKYIDKSAFANCFNLEEIVYENHKNITIDKLAFFGCNKLARMKK